MPRADGWPVSRTRCVTTASRSASPRRADALAILAGPLATRASTVKPAFRALFCATHSDWERFDEIFDAYWQGRGVRQARMLAGTAQEGRARSRHLKDVGPRAWNARPS